MSTKQKSEVIHRVPYSFNMRFLTIAFVFGFAALCSALPADLPLLLLSEVKAPALNASLISEKAEGVVGAAEDGVENILGDAAEVAEGGVGAAEDGVENILGDAEDEEDEAVEDSDDEKADLKESVVSVGASNKTSSDGIRIPRLGIRTHIGVIIPRLRI
ncbi:unnamed protein product [Ceratitis capitata]|uniref:(Mediterranean fruit fly) hypothetical protein n=1 Tax=Ceratitis capitata TaxID=7213 RepID=A0A811UVA6_CERCA|nr:unnamed protein product [Ceratitis capitata]